MNRITAATLFFASHSLAPTMDPRPCAERISRIADVIAQVEHVRPSLNNPLAISPRGVPVRFRTAGEGWSRGLAAIERRARQGATVASLMRRWAPVAPSWYGHLVAKRAGIELDAPICVGRNAF